MAAAMHQTHRQAGPSAGEIAARVQVGDVAADYAIDWGSCVGRGHYAAVYRATQRRTGQAVAAKIVDLGRVPGQLRALDELETHLLCSSCPGVLPLLAAYLQPASVVLVLPLVPAGDLLDHVAATNGGVPEASARATVISVLGVLRFMHANDLVHRDIKLENLLLGGAGTQLCDFGFATFLPSSGSLVVPCYTLNYVAPEVIAGQGYGVEVDCWALGVATYLLLCAQPPFGPGGSRQDVLAEALDGDYACPATLRPGLAPAAVDFVRTLLTVDPARRATADDAWGHPWLGQDPDTEPPLVDVASYRQAFAQVVATWQPAATAPSAR